MSSELKNLSTPVYPVPSAERMKFGIVVAEWNTEITEALAKGCEDTLIDNGADPRDVRRIYVPGSFELPLAAQMFCEEQDVDAVICIGCVIQGDTRHFDFICNAVATGITDVGLKYSIPIIFGVLTPNTLEQAKDRAGGKHGNKGDEAAITAIKMVAMRKYFTSELE